MYAILKGPNEEWKLSTPQWNNELIGEWLNQILRTHTNYPPNKGPQVPINYTLEIGL